LLRGHQPVVVPDQAAAHRQEDHGHHHDPDPRTAHPSRSFRFSRAPPANACSRASGHSCSASRRAARRPYQPPPPPPPPLSPPPYPPNHPPPPPTPPLD